MKYWIGITFNLKGQSVLFNANQPNIPLHTFPSDHNSPVGVNDIGLNMDSKPGSSSGVYNTSFLVPDDLPSYNSTYLAPPNYENASVTLNTNLNTLDKQQNPSSNAQTQMW